MRHLLLASAIAILPFATAAQSSGNLCDPNPVFPPDCVSQLGAIGDPVAVLPGEGFLNIVSPVIDPLLELTSSGVSNGLLYVLNPTGNMVRVLDEAAALAVVKDIPVCYRPSALAQSDDGALLLVACHASNVIDLIDTSRNLVVGSIQDRDSQGRPLLQEPMAMAVRGNSVYVASSQSNQVAEIDLAARRVSRYFSVPGTEPRALRLTPDGKFLIVANLLAGNRTEPGLGVAAGLVSTATAVGSVCGPLLLNDPTALAVFTETDPNFMDTSHPQFATIAECYLFNQAFAPTQNVVISPTRSDYDLVVLRTSDGAVVSSSNGLAQDIGTLNYDVALNAAGTRIYLVGTHSRNALNENFQPRPILNRMVMLDLDPASGALSLASAGIVDLDASFLAADGSGASRAAIPHAVAVGPGQVLVAASGSDAVLVLDINGTLLKTLPAGFGPMGVMVRGSTALVYNSTGQSVSQVDLATGQEVARATVGPSPLPQSERIGAHLFGSAKFSSNQTFACASCHPEGHTDGLVWKLDAADGLRSTMTVEEISETDPYHWDGSKCNFKKILQDGINFLMLNPAGPTDCEIKTMSDWMNHLVRPHSPFRPADDSFTSEALLGLMDMHRGRFKDTGNVARLCDGRPEDPATEQKLLVPLGDPFGAIFKFDGGGGPFPASLVSESCSNANCHVTPHWESDGFRQGNPDLGLIDGFQAVSNAGSWDRLDIMHDARPGRERYLFALDRYRVFSGAPPVRTADNYGGVFSTHGFNDQFFRHPEYNFDGDPATHAFVLTDAMTRFSQEEEELQTGAVGLSVVLDAANQNNPAVTDLLDRLITAASEGKIVLHGRGVLAGSIESLTWDVLTASFSLSGGSHLFLPQVKNSLEPGDAVSFRGDLLPGQESLPHPKLVQVSRTGSPILCAEGYTDYLASVQTSESQVTLLLEGIDLVAGSSVLLDGQVAGAKLAGPGPDFLWNLPVAGGVPTIRSIQVMNPLGMQSNSVPLPVVAPVIAAVEPGRLVAGLPAGQFSWPAQFGITGPGTRFDVFRGRASDLRVAGFGTGACLAEDLFPASVFDPGTPVPGDAFYYLVRAENQVNVSSYGSPQKDAGINGAAGACKARFPAATPPPVAQLETPKPAP